MELRGPRPISDFDQVLAVVQEYDRAIFGDTDWTEQELRDDPFSGAGACVALGPRGRQTSGKRSSEKVAELA